MESSTDHCLTTLRQSAWQDVTSKFMPLFGSAPRVDPDSWNRFLYSQNSRCLSVYQITCDHKRCVCAYSVTFLQADTADDFLSVFHAMFLETPPCIRTSFFDFGAYARLTHKSGIHQYVRTYIFSQSTLHCVFYLLGVYLKTSTLQHSALFMTNACPYMEK